MERRRCPRPAMKRNFFVLCAAMLMIFKVSSFEVSFLKGLDDHVGRGGHNVTSLLQQARGGAGQENELSDDQMVDIKHKHFDEHHEHEHEEVDLVHKCIHDEIVADVQVVTMKQQYVDHPFERAKQEKKEEEHTQLLMSGQKTSGHYVTPTTTEYKSGSSFEPIRLYFDESHLLASADTGYKCSKFGDIYEDQDGNQRACQNDEIATQEKVNFLRNVLLPQALDFYSKALRVHPVSNNLILSNGYQGSMKCVNANMKSTHTQSPGGVGSYDYALYITARPTQGSTAAWAAACQVDQYDRPIAGQANFGPNNIKVTTDPTGLAGQVSTAIHEIGHALGFSASSFDKFRNPDGTPRGNIKETFSERGTTVVKLTSPKILAKAKEHFGCSTLNGVEIENGGGGGTKGSHWEKRIFNNEFMTGSHSFGETVYSAVTLALFEDSGWYGVDYSIAGDLLWGNDMGCQFAMDRCDTWPTQAKNEGMFCSVPQGVGCTGSVGQYKGFCNKAQYGSSLPSYFQYFPESNSGGQDQLMDFCPSVIAYSNGDCRVAANEQSHSNSVFGESFKPESRCFVNTLIKQGYQNQGQDRTGCYPTKCVVSGGTVTLYVDVGGTEVACPTNGGTVSGISGMTGSLTCPRTSAMCVHSTSAAEIVCPSDCNGRGSCADGKCTCNVPYTGPSCEETQFPETTDQPAPVVETTQPSSVEDWSEPQTTQPASNSPKVLSSGQSVSSSCCEWTYFVSNTPILPSQIVSIVVVPTNMQSNPDVYAAFTKIPTIFENLKRSATGGDGETETLEIATDTPGRPLTESLLYIGVFGWGVQGSEFTVVMTVTDASCDAAKDCNSHGSCNTHGGCDCATGWSGMDCATPDCPGSPDCSDVGECVTNQQQTPHCVCDADYSGDACQTWTEPASGNNDQKLANSGGTRNVTELELGAWKYYEMDLADPAPVRVAIEFKVSCGPDSTTYKDPNWGDSCVPGWVGYSCVGYSFSDELMKNCPVTCRVCGSTMLMFNYNKKPEIAGTSISGVFDQQSWQQNDDLHQINLTDIPWYAKNIWIGIKNDDELSQRLGKVNGVLSVIATYPQVEEPTEPACSRETTCNDHGECEKDEDKAKNQLCICDSLYHGSTCSYQIKEVKSSESSSSSSSSESYVEGSVLGKQYDFFYYEVTDDEVFTVHLLADGPDHIRPRLFVRKAPHLPIADQLAFTDFPAAEANLKKLSVRVAVADLGAGIWYIGVYNAAEATSQDEKMTFRVSVTSASKSTRITEHCQAWESDTGELDATFICPGSSEAVISEIDGIDIWFNSDEVSTCSSASGTQKSCHQQVCPPSVACLGKNTCTIENCDLPEDFTEQCINNNNDEKMSTGMKLLFKCKVEEDVCKVSSNPCGPKGECENENGFAMCECLDGWLGSDCKTPPAFGAKLGADSNAPEHSSFIQLLQKERFLRRRQSLYQHGQQRSLSNEPTVLQI